MVNEFLELNWSRGMKPDILIAQFCMYGDDPVIVPADNPANKKFSGREYVNEIAVSICKKLENE